MDDAYIDGLYEEVRSLYHLDQNFSKVESAGKTDLGKLPTASIILLASIVIAWIAIGIYALVEKNKKI